METMEPRLLLAGTVVISEFLAINQTGLVDKDADHSDWIELHNTDPSLSVNIGGWYLTDDASNLRQWAFPSAVIPPDGYIWVYASGKNYTASQPYHTNFTLSVADEYLALVKPDGTTVTSQFSPAYPQQRPDFSYGPGGYYATPTPGKANTAPPVTGGFVNDTKFDHDRGFYDAAFDLVISTATVGATIRYTTDGSVPTATTGTVYSGPIHVARTTVLRAAAYKDGCLPSNVDTVTYLFLADVVTQTRPAGYPATWNGDPGGSDYDMDPEVVALYSSTVMRNALKAVPTLSIVMNKDDMFGARGLYQFPDSRGIEWERSASVELINPDGSEGFQIDAGIQMQGGAAREPGKTSKHPMALRFKGDYGDEQLVYPFFGDSATDRFDAITLRAGFNNSWTHWDGSQRSRAQYVRDEFAHNLQLAMGDPSPHNTYVHLYINGIYWGLYNPAERPDEAFAAEYFGGSRADWDVIHGGDLGTVAEAGDMVAWNAMHAIANDAGRTADQKFQDIQAYLDVNNLIDYMILNFYLGTTDWDQHNWYAARRRAAGAGFKFFSWDAERCVENVDANSTGIRNNLCPTNLHQALMGSAEYKLRFADRVQKFFFNDGPLTAANAAAAWNDLSTQLDRQTNPADPQTLFSAVVAESARWGDNRRDHRAEGGAALYTREGFWVPQRTWVTGTFLPQRSNKMIKIDPATGAISGQFYNIGAYPNLGPASFSQQGGTIPPGGLDLTMTARTGTIYYTTDGTDPRRAGGDVAPGAQVYGVPVHLTYNTIVKARVKNGSTWSALNEAIFAGANPPAVRVTEVMYHAPEPPLGSPYGASEFDFIELQNIGAEPADLTGLGFAGGPVFAFPAMTLPAGEYVLVVKKRAAFESRYGTALRVAGEYTGTLYNDTGTLRLESIFTGLVQEFTYCDWYPNTDGEGFSIVIRDPAEADLNLWNSQDAWRPSWLWGGNPGAADPGPVNPKAVVFNEVLAHTHQPGGNWVELKNLTDSPVSISGWYLSDDPANLMKYRIGPDNTIPPQSYKVFSQDGDFGAAFALSPGGGGLYLSASASPGVLAGYREDECYGASDPEVSIGRYYKSTGGKDFVALVQPTKGGANAGPAIPPVVINEIMYGPPVAGDEFIELRNLTGSDVPLYDPCHPDRRWRFLDGITYSFPAGACIPAGGYALVVPLTPTEFRSRYNLTLPIEQIFGPYVGLLDNVGETIELGRPAEAEGAFIRVDRVTYSNLPPWPAAPDGAGPSLERIESGLYGNDVADWMAGPAGGTPGLENSVAPPRVTAVDLNGRSGRSAGAIDPGSAGVRTIEVIFSKPVTFALDDVLVQTVTFDGNAETILSTVSLLAADGSGTNRMTMALPPGAALDTWVKVTLRGAGTLQDAHCPNLHLDGEPAPGGSGRAYVFSGTADLPTGNAVSGGDAVFYVGSLRGDFGTAGGPQVPDGLIGPEDIDGFLAEFFAADPEADFRGTGFGAPQPDGRITEADIDGFLAAYQEAAAEGRRLAALPNPGPEGGGAPAPLAAPESAADAGPPAAGQPDPVEAVLLDAQPTDVSIPVMASPAGGAAADAEKTDSAAAAVGDAPAAVVASDAPRLAIEGAAEGSVPLASSTAAPPAAAADAAIDADRNVVDVLALPPLTVPLSG
jgi:hypothetical protein